MNFLLKLAIVIIVTISTLTTQAQRTATDSARTWLRQHRQSIDIETYPSFTQTMKPVLDNLADKQVIGLGEGTHGTSEFQTVRSWITRYLCEEKGFTAIILENSYGWSEKLNQYIQTGEGDLDSLMQLNMLGMWQNVEMRELILWMRQYNQTHPHKLRLAGMDYSETTLNAHIIRSIASRRNIPAFKALADSLFTRAQFMDAAYADMNNKKPAYKWQDILDNGVKAYDLTLRIKAMLDTQEPPGMRHLYTTLYNSELAYYSIYRPVKERQEASRDEAMALMVKRIAEELNNAKVVVWAHNAHLAKAPIFGDDSNGGGTGMYLDDFFPGNYTVIGTGTAEGSYSSTDDRYIVNTSQFKSHTLFKAVANSWETQIRMINNTPCYIDARNKEYLLPKLPLRFTGYGKSDKGDFVSVRINTLFDGFIFIPVTTATHIQQ